VFVAVMGNFLSNFFQTGSSLLSSSNNRGVSEQTKKIVRDVFDALRANPRITAHRLEGLLMQIPKVTCDRLVITFTDYRIHREHALQKVE
jgi:hypothetical protein